MLDRSLNKVIRFYETYISSLWDALREAYDGIYINLQMQFLKKRIISVYTSNIYLVNFWYNIWSEYNWIRPAIVLSSSYINATSICIVIPITSYKWKKWFQSDIIIDPIWENGLSQKSIIRTTHIYTISKKRVIKQIWKIGDDVYDKIHTTIMNDVFEK